MEIIIAEIMLRKIILSLVLFFPVLSSIGQSSFSVRIENSMFVAEGTSVFINSDEFHLEDDDFESNGVLYWNNIENMSFSRSNLGFGTFFLISDGDVDVLGDEIDLGSLIVNIDGGELNLDIDVNVGNSLEMMSGRVNLQNDHFVRIQNSSPEAIVFDESIDNMDYIVGNLTRKISLNQTYVYPIGSDDAYHPFSISSSENEDFINVSFNKDIPFDWESSNVNRTLKLHDVGGWKVSSDEFGDNKFLASLSLIDENGYPIPDNYNIFYSDDPVFFSQTVKVLSTITSNDDMFTVSNTKGYTGAYALVEDVVHLQDIPNAIIVNERNETRFKFEIEKFRYLKLRIYDSLGREIYKSSSYSNDFDTKDFFFFLYYYYLEGEFLDGQKVIKNDILEIIRTK